MQRIYMKYVFYATNAIVAADQSDSGHDRSRLALPAETAGVRSLQRLSDILDHAGLWAIE
jgi:hypothetical protein